MADRLSTQERSRNMSAIKSKDTKPEIYFGKKLFALGFRYRKNTAHVVGHPDIFLAKYNTAIFVNGCFWHRHKGCKYAYTPKSRVEFWEKKFASNVLRDQTVRQELMQKKVKCLIVWECTIKQMMKSDEFETDILSRAKDFLLSDMEYLEL